MTMSADELELPPGVEHAIRVNGMREISQFNIVEMNYLFRWDTMINGEKHTHMGKYDGLSHANIEKYIASERAVALEKFKKIEEAS